MTIKERIAERLYHFPHKQKWEKASKEQKEYYLHQASAILPIIEEVRAAADKVGYERAMKWCTGQVAEGKP